VLVVDPVQPPANVVVIRRVAIKIDAAFNDRRIVGCLSGRFALAISGSRQRRAHRHCNGEKRHGEKPTHKYLQHG